MHRPLRGLVLTATAALTAAGIALPLSAHATSPALVRLTTAADDLSHYRDLGPLAPTTAVQTALVLGDGNVAAEQRLLADQAAGRAGFVTPAQYEAAYAVPQTTYQRASAFATAHGLTVSFVSGLRDYLLLSGTAAQVERTFAVSLDRFAVPGLARTYYAATTDPLVPTGADIAGVLGLDDMRGAHPLVASQDICAAGTCVGPLNIGDFTKPYDLPAVYTGQGQKLAVFGEGNYKAVVADLRVFEKTFHRPQIAVRPVLVGDDQTSTDGTDEWDLDTQSSSGIATGARELDLYFGQDLTDAAINATYAKWASDRYGPLQANASFGECEPIGGGLSTPVVAVPGVGGVAIGSQSIAAYLAQESHLRQARAEGRTLFASSGDQGGSCGVGVPNAFENNGVPALNVPAASVNAVGVGGTDLTTNQSTGARVTETAANAAGGGSSLSIHADSYQRGIVTSLPQRPLAPCLVTQQGTPDTSGALCRSLPDVSAECGNISVLVGGSGLNIVVAGQPTTVAGTSLSSPLNMGMWARVQSADRRPAGYGFANLTFYRLGKQQQAVGVSKTFKNPFYDVTLGSNDQQVAAAGYDQTTGWGVPDVADIVADLRR